MSSNVEGADVVGVPHVAVVGAGVSGLATAYFLAQSADAPRVTLVEAEQRAGGKVLTVPVLGRHVDTGPDGLMLRTPGVRELVDELGLSGALVEPTTARSSVWTRRGLRPLPPLAASGVPTRLLPVLRSRTLSARGVLRAGMDLVLPPTPMPDDPSVAEVLAPRLGRQVVDRLAAPLLGGVYAGRVDSLSALAATPDLAAAARRGRSLIRSLRVSAPTAPKVPSFGTFSGGMAQLVEGLGARLDRVELLLGCRLTTLEPAAQGYRLHLSSGRTVDADAVVLAVPGFAAAALLAPLQPELAGALAEIPYADVAAVVLAYPADGARGLPTGSGFLTPPSDGRLLVGCTLLSAKWPHLDDPATVFVRCLVGRHGDSRWRSLDDTELVSRVHGELAEATGLSAAPEYTVVQRWPAGLPQYTVGHHARLAAVDTALRELPGVFLTGAAYRGVGVASCIAQAERTAAEVLATLPSMAGR